MLCENKSYRNSELERLEKSEKFKVGPSLEFKKKMLDYYLRQIEQTKFNQKERKQKSVENKMKQSSYGKWYIQPDLFR